MASEISCQPIENNFNSHIDHKIDQCGSEKDPYKAACMNVKECEKEIEASLEIQEVEHLEGLKVIGAMYHLENGIVDFLL